ncbi:xanthine dehydrogenase family protein molybdopterin-binding subunit [Thalassovita aquimarina]|uniref:Xanthine dehydrogenase family protein molybdopterin-binding subunit n=1 Tax=Thalassovita aquimarina TaxID=2785917 RepID=A0ABS5HNX5_9RHOB|nr:molybdopterin cofactor-binding domain-containing protein [Thalassovita aquimarina]MBR9650649.1 xanthine dehydrogenase family protein molybdopterin-binding subunit [Thalassovita aquimarina]
MSRVGKIARRSFLIGSAAILGGVAFGVYRVKTPYANPLEYGLAEGSATFNPWVLIDAEKVTLITPHADKGQGVASAQAALIAEELDIEFGQFEISFGAPDKAYWNTAMAAEGAPFMASDDSFLAETTRGVMGGAIKLLGMQMTGGSSAMPDSFVKLREAGAVARETLKLAASKQTGVPVARLKTANGAVQLPDGTALKYTELAGIAAGLDPVRNVSLRAPSEWRLIGKPMQRLDMLAKVTGTQGYGIDLQIDGIVHATVRMNPRQGGAINGYDDSAAKAMPGVKAILPITGGVAVVADNTWRAFQAADAIDCDWGPAPYPAEQDDHWAEVAASFTKDQLDKTWRDEGDAAAATAQGAFEAEYRSPYVAHQPLEPLNAVIRVTDEAVDVWSGQQVPRLLQQIVGKVTGHKPAQVRFHNQFIGGSFGHRLEFEYLKQAAEIAKQMPGTPVKLTYKREEDFAHDFPRHIAMARGKGTVADGKVVAMDLSIASPSVMTSQMGRAGIPVPGPDMQIVAGAWNNAYALPNLRVRGYRVPELAPVSSWRSVGAAGAGFFFDSFLDELIHEAGADPMAERIRMMNHDLSRKVLETVAEMSSWGGELAPGKGRGVAFVESFGVPTAEVVEVTNTDDGIRIDKVWVAAEVGQVVDPVNFENLVQGGVVFGLGHAMNSRITYADGMAEQANFWDAEGMRNYQCPEIFVKGLENGSKVRGIGEPPVPPAAPALANAIFAATGKRLREMPFNQFVDFV